MTKPKFDPTVNLGHLLTIVALVVSVFGAYMSVVRTQDNHSLRLEAMEKRETSNVVMQQQILNTLTTIREDIATLKARGQIERRPF